MSEVDPFDLADAEQPHASEEARRLRQATDESDLKWLIADPRGRRFMRRLLEKARVFQSTFTGDALSAAFQEGERNVGLWLIANITDANPAVLGSILTEEPHVGPNDADPDE